MKFGGTPFSYATTSGREAVVKLVLATRKICSKDRRIRPVAVIVGGRERARSRRRRGRPRHGDTRPSSSC